MCKIIGTRLVNVEIYAYALQLVLMSVLNLILVILVALFLRIIPTTFAFCVYTFGGGVHLNTFPRCFTTDSCLMLGSAYLAAEINNRISLQSFIYLRCYLLNSVS